MSPPPREMYVLVEFWLIVLLQLSLLPCFAVFIPAS